MYELLKFAIPLLNTFPKNQKFVLADRIQNHLSDCYEDLLRAYYASRPDEKKIALQKANLTVEMLRNYFRLCHELRLITFKQYTQCSLKLNEIGRMIGGWLKYLG